MDFTPEKFQRLRTSLLPDGPIWPHGDDDANLQRLLAAKAEEDARVAGAGLQLVDEADPRTGA